MMAGIGPLAVSIIGGYIAEGAWWGYAAGSIVGSLLFPQRIDMGPRQVSRVNVTAPNRGAPLPIIYGKTKVPGNILWVGEFEKRETPTGKGGKGGKGIAAGAAMKYSISPIIGLCEGAIDDHLRLWVGGDERDLADVTYTLRRGLPGQAPIAGLELDEGQKPLSYPHVAYICIRDFDLGGTATLPNLTFEVSRTDLSDNPALPIALLGDTATNDDGDLNQALIIGDLLTHPRYGVGIAADRIDWASFQTVAQFVADNRLHVSPAIDTSRAAADWIQEILTTFDGLLTYSQGQFRLALRRYANAPTTTTAWGTPGAVGRWRESSRGSQRPIVANPLNPNQLVMVWQSGTHIRYSLSGDGGVTWGAPGFVDNGANFAAAEQVWPCLCVTPDGTAHCVFTSDDTTFANRQVWYTNWTWAGAWAASVRVSDGAGTNLYPQGCARIVGDSTNQTHVVWNGRDGGIGILRHQIWLKRRSAGGLWSAIDCVSYEGGGDESWLYFGNYHPAIVVAPDDSLHVAFCRAVALPIDYTVGSLNDDWWWGIVPGGQTPWPDQPVPPGWYIPDHHAKLCHRRRTLAGVWSTVVDVQRETTGVKKPGYPFVSPCVITKPDSEPVVIYQHRPKTVFDVSQIFLVERTAGTWSAPVRLSDAEGQQFYWNAEPWIALNAWGDWLTYWSGWNPALSPHTPLPIVHSSWMRRRDAIIGLWNEPTHLRVLPQVAVTYSQWSIKSLSPSPGVSGYIGAWVCRREGPILNAGFHYCHQVTATPGSDPTVIDHELDRRDWVVGGAPTVTMPGQRDTLNAVRVTYLHRGTDYAEAVMQVRDDWNATDTGERGQSWLLPAITRASVAYWVARRAVAMARYPRSHVTCKLGPRRFTIAPGDLASIDDDRVDLVGWIGRVESVREEDATTLVLDLIEEPAQPVIAPTAQALWGIYPQPSIIPPYDESVR